eukprot:361296-Pelagomonas_calceolata.AAC.1
MSFIYGGLREGLGVQWWRRRILAPRSMAGNLPDPTRPFGWHSLFFSFYHIPISSARAARTVFWLTQGKGHIAAPAHKWLKGRKRKEGITSLYLP